MGESRHATESTPFALLELTLFSRHELLIWMNDLLQLNITKVEQCGYAHRSCRIPIEPFDGACQKTDIELMDRAALCQIYDSIFRKLELSNAARFHIC